MKKRICIFLLLALLLAGCGGGNTGTTAPDTTLPDTSNTEETGDIMDYSAYKSTANVLCYNIFYQNVDSRAANIRDLIEKKDPDILLLQEVSVAWIPYLQTFMQEEGYSYYGYGRKGGELSQENLDSGDQFVPILWKTDKYELVDAGHFWASATPDVVYSAAWADGTVSKFPRCINWVILKDKATGGELVTMNIHTDPESDRVRTNTCALAIEQLAQIRQGRPAIIGGDFNMQLVDTGYEIMTSDGYCDIRFTAAEADEGGSFNNWGKREEGNFAMGDHIFMTDDMASSLFDVVDDVYDGDHISDHNPLQTVIYY